MLTLAAWLHNIDPFAIQFPDWSPLPGIRWYGLAYLSTFVLGYLFCRRIVRVGITTLRPTEVMDFVITVAIAVVVGGRLGYVIFYRPDLITTFSSDFPFWGVFQIGGGGMSSHGGMIGVGLATWWYAWRSRRPASLAESAPQVDQRIDPRRLAADRTLADHTRCHKCGHDLHGAALAGNCSECGTPVKASLAGHSWLHLFDLTALVATLGFLFGRIANFVNAELIGRVCDPQLPIAVKFPQELAGISAAWIGRSTAAAQQLRALTPAAEAIGIPPADWNTAIAKGDVATVDRGIDGMIQAIQAGGGVGDTVSQYVEPLLLPHHPSQIYAAITEGLIVFLVLVWLWRKPRKPGVIAGMFGALYGVMRFLNEFFRTPDAHIADEEFAAIGLTRGQLLSIALIVGGAALTWWSARRTAPRMGGWMSRA